MQYSLKGQTELEPKPLYVNYVPSAKQEIKTRSQFEDVMLARKDHDDVSLVNNDIYSSGIDDDVSMVKNDIYSSEVDDDVSMVYNDVYSSGEDDVDDVSLVDNDIYG